MKVWVVKRSEDFSDGVMDYEIMGIFESFWDAKDYSQKEKDSDDSHCIFIDEHTTIESKKTVEVKRNV